MLAPLVLRSATTRPVPSSRSLSARSFSSAFTFTPSASSLTAMRPLFASALAAGREAAAPGATCQARDAQAAVVERGVDLGVGHLVLAERQRTGIERELAVQRLQAVESTPACRQARWRSRPPCPPRAACSGRGLSKWAVASMSGIAPAKAARPWVSKRFVLSEPFELPLRGLGVASRAALHGQLQRLQAGLGDRGTDVESFERRCAAARHCSSRSAVACP